jgi:hypothetical protein
MLYHSNMNSPTPAETKAAMQMTFAVAETIREAGQVPSGTVYAALIGKVTLEGYQKLIGILKGAGLIQEDASHLLRWVGPALEVRR